MMMMMITITCVYGSTENAGPENAGMENAGPENTGPMSLHK